MSQSGLARALSLLAGSRLRALDTTRPVNCTTGRAYVHLTLCDPILRPYLADAELASAVSELAHVQVYLCLVHEVPAAEILPISVDAVRAAILAEAAVAPE